MSNNCYFLPHLILETKIAHHNTQAIEFELVNESCGDLAPKLEFVSLLLSQRQPDKVTLVI
jgi:hypothetical protein